MGGKNLKIYWDKDAYHVSNITWLEAQLKVQITFEWNEFPFFGGAKRCIRGRSVKVCLVHMEHTFVCFIQVRWRSLNFQFVLDTPPKGTARARHGNSVRQAFIITEGAAQVRWDMILIYRKDMMPS